MRRRTEIVIETERLLISHNDRKIPVLHSTEALTWCETCSIWVKALSRDEAALLSQAGSFRTFHQGESGEIHYMESPKGLVLICPNSVPVPLN